MIACSKNFVQRTYHKYREHIWSIFQYIYRKWIKIPEQMCEFYCLLSLSYSAISIYFWRRGNVTLKLKKEYQKLIHFFKNVNRETIKNSSKILWIPIQQFSFYLKKIEICITQMLKSHVIMHNINIYTNINVCVAINPKNLKDNSADFINTLYPH